MKYRADVDGLRAVAVIPVVLFHAGVAGFSGGFVGVDVFFVISGYVITLRLLSDLQQDRFSIVDFYGRRVRRIFPALFFMIALTALAAWFLLLPPSFSDFSSSAVATALFGSNVYFWRFSGYFEPAAMLRPLLHTWSLAVEEQYYLLMPVALYVASRWLKARWLLLFLPAAVLSFVLSAYAAFTAPTANFFLLPTRAWELLLGVLLVLSPLPAVSRKWVAEALCAAGMALILFAVFFYSERTPFPGATALLPCLGAALIIHVGASNATLVGRLLSIRPMVAIGLLSYSIYLAHWPIAAFVRYVTLRDPTLAESALIVLASFALGWFSWRFVEQPFRRPGNPFTRRRLFAMAAAAIAIVTLAGIAGKLSGGAAFRFPDFQEVTDADRQTWTPGVCFLEADQTWRDWGGDECALTRGQQSNAMLWGDSFAAHYIPGIVANAASIPYNVLAYTAAGCPPILDYHSYGIPHCRDFNRHALEIIRQYDVKAVVLSARWGSLRHGDKAGLRSTLDALRAEGVQVYVLAQSPEFGANVDLIDYRSGNSEDASWTSIVDPAVNRELEQIVGEGAAFVDPLIFLCEGEQCSFKTQGVLRYFDFGHFSASGSTEAVGLYFPLIDRQAALLPDPDAAASR